MVSFDSHRVDERGYTTSLKVGKQEILAKWGIEFSDGNGFFIHGKEGNAPMSLLSLSTNEKETQGEMVVHLKTTDLRISMHEKFFPKKIVREYVFIPSHDTFMQDISISQGFVKGIFSSMKIGSETITFTGKERNHQFNETKVILNGKEFDLRIEYESSHSGTGFSPMIYGRTSPKDGWVVHARLFPKVASKKVIVWCNPLWNKKIPFSDILVHIKPLVDYLWNIGELPERAHIRMGGLTAYGLAEVKKDIPISFTETITLIPKKIQAKKKK
ncbi:MAG: hypothetical protein V1776_02750 [Candidatus Diapherotrites archaeon]